ncbi:MAG TPA: hypothetical protein VLG50_00935 [Candidatus Saccharimonadales bacterium]|nr:hypothetical protein [Candidatus Saccharimonadales bacterium]
MTNKSRISLFLTFFLTFDIHSASKLIDNQTSVTKTADNQRSVNVVVNVTGNGNAANSATADSGSIAASVSKQYIVDHKIDFGIVSSLNDVLTKLHHAGESTYTSVQNIFGIGKYKLCALAVISAYGIASYKLYLGNQLLESHEAWCNWKEVISLSHLVTSPYEDTIKQLMIDIQKKYFSLSGKEPAQSMYALFFKDVQEEIDLLKNYLWWSNNIKTLHCSGCFYLQESCVLEEKIARLNFMIDIFIKWQVEHFA